MSSAIKQKLYCYVDEAGQDDASRAFVVVAVVSDQEQEALREALMEIERAAATGHRKWHENRPARRLLYLELVLARGVGRREVFFGSFAKPLPVFFPMIEVVEAAIKARARVPYVAWVFVDGIDRKKAAELTNALRLRDVSLEMVKARRDATRVSPLSASRTCGLGVFGRWSSGEPRNGCCSSERGRKVISRLQKKNPLKITG